VTIRLGAAMARAALARSHVRSGAVVACALVAAAGHACRSGDADGADRALLGFTLALVVPFACFGVFEGLYGRTTSAFFTEPLARHGADRHELALGSTLVAAGVCAVLSAALCLVATITATLPQADTFSELAACAWGGGLTGAAYAGLFALGSLRGRTGRVWILLGDWLFGSGSSSFALPWVRGHARNLLGGRAVLDFSPGLAAAALALIAALTIVGSARRGPS
jgi:hypothetical protein